VPQLAAWATQLRQRDVVHLASYEDEEAGWEK